MINFFNWSRMLAVLYKEFVQMRRDRTTFAMIIGIPLIQLLLFGYAINTNPKNLPIGIVAADYSPFTRELINGMNNTAYFRFTKIIASEQEAQRELATGNLQFILTIPPNFSQQLIRGEHPNLLLDADATDPSATGQALAAMQALIPHVFDRYLTGNLQYLRQSVAPVNFIVHPQYNPDIITQYNIVPGLMGVVLTMTLVIITSLGITRERERGTMENLLAMPVTPLEVMIGKVLPYVVVGYLQVTVILTAAYFLFGVPFMGNLLLLFLASLPFIAANLAMGLTFSTLAKNQLQAMQMAFFFFLPSILLSGFMFPFRGMPVWAQWLGTCLPLTHFIRIVRGIMLKDNGLLEIYGEIIAILLFLFVVVLLGLKRFRRTLD